MADYVLEQLRLARENRDLAEADVEAKVKAAREAGRTWDAIAAVLGVSRPAAWERYHDRVDPGHQAGSGGATGG